MNLRLERLVWRRANRACEYCQIEEDRDSLPFQIDHILARKHGGRGSPENLALACFSCNNRKGPNIAGRDPVTGRVSRLFNPRRDKWRQHFRWKGPTLLGVSAPGRTTVEVLEVNLPRRVALREALIEEGVFPPASTRPEV